MTYKIPANNINNHFEQPSFLLRNTTMKSFFYVRWDLNMHRMEAIDAYIYKVMVQL